MIKNLLLQDSIEKLGFTRVTLSDDNSICKKLEDLYKVFYKNKTQGISVSHNNPEDLRALNIHHKIVETVEPYFQESFQDYKILASHFVVKTANGNESFQLHQDWNVVDENEYYNFQVWIPLSLSYPENGGICFIPQSHLFYNTIRSGSLDIPRIPIEDKLHPYLSFLRLFPGEAAVFYSKTFHGSFINSSPKDRVAVLVNIIQKKATPIYYHKQGDSISAYKLGTEEIFKQLPKLEIGEAPISENIYKSNIPNNNLENVKIDADDLIKKIHAFNLKAGRATDYEHKLYKILKDNRLENEINHKGYAVVSLLQKEEIESLKNKFEEVFPNRKLFTGSYSTIKDTSIEVKKEAHDFIISTIKNRLDEFFENYFTPGSLLYSRRPDNQFVLELHNDPSLILNEHLEPFYGIWCPLVDVDETHGVLNIVPGSHRLSNKLNFAFNVFKWDFIDKRNLLNKFIRGFKLKAGEAIIFDARMMHASSPNKSTIDRDNIVLRINHKDSKYFNLITESNKSNYGSLYKQDKGYFFTNTIKEHNVKSDKGGKQGDMYLFFDEIEDSYIQKKLNRYHDQ